jgi:hypothetical protein
VYRRRKLKKRPRSKKDCRAIDIWMDEESMGQVRNLVGET